MDHYGISADYRRVVPPSRAVQRDAEAAGVQGVQGAAMELRDGTIVTGRTSDLMSAPSALVLNAVKTLSGLPGEMHLLSPGTISSIAALKTEVLGMSPPRLDLEEVLIALSVSAMTSPAADLAMRALPELSGRDAHLTAMPSTGDGAGLRKLGITVTSDARFLSDNLFLGE
jgi:uncharacterized protein (UPF0371 family)